MQIPEPKQQGYLVKRYQRFLADIRLLDHTTVTVHCPNSGAMKGCSTPGSEVVISRSPNPKRKYPWTLEMVRENNCWIGVNTSLTNKLVREGLESGIIDDFGPIDTIQAEVKVADKSRLDFLVHAGGSKWYIEVKNCSLVENGVALFPDAVTSRGTRHLRELERLRLEGVDTAVIFCVQRADAARFMPARSIDPEYADTLYRVHDNGVRALAYLADVSPDGVTIVRKIPVFDTAQPSEQ
ncbi:MAG: DNA/RNA nuclease SfsA [Desulfobulbaceae bacterium]|nr:DNA/RNA nuclease SfsA [Desulfobulbaceae bacterium]